MSSGCGCNEVYRFPHITYPYSCICSFLQQHPYLLFVNHRRACARVTVYTCSVCVSVCLSVCVFSLFWHLAQSGVQTAVSATSARYGHEIKKGFFFKTLRSEVMASFTHSPRVVPASFQGS